DLEPSKASKPRPLASPRFLTVMLYFLFSLCFSLILQLPDLSKQLHPLNFSQNKSPANHVLALRPNEYCVESRCHTVFYRNIVLILQRHHRSSPYSHRTCYVLHSPFAGSDSLLTDSDRWSGSNLPDLPVHTIHTASESAPHQPLPKHSLYSGPGLAHNRQ